MNIYGRKHHCQHTHVITKLFYNESRINILLTEFFRFKCTDHFKHHNFHLVQTSFYLLLNTILWFLCLNPNLWLEWITTSTALAKTEKQNFPSSFHCSFIKYPSPQRWANCDLWVNFYHSKLDSGTLTLE
jgi:hypothetical protein